MSAVRTAPWTLRVYAVIVTATAILNTVLSHGRGALGLLIAPALAVGVCQGSRLVWWFLVVLNTLVVAASSLLFPTTWIAAAASGVVALLCLLAPQSRQHVFPPTEPEPLSSQQT
jgi:hypothetical protein